MQKVGNNCDLEALMERMQSLHESVIATQAQLLEAWRPHLRKPEFHRSAANLAAYIGLRRHDLRTLQADLAATGLSSLGRCEGHVLATLEAVMHALKRMLGKEVALEEIEKSKLAMEEDQLILKRHTNQLLGEAPSHRWTRFMVTFPAEAATDYPFVRDLLTRGMSCARINCAHDNPVFWKNMIDNLRRAELEAGKRCKVLMDLSGPKLRTGPVSLGPPILHINPKRDREGKTLKEANVVLDSSGRPGSPERPSLSVPHKWLKRLHAGDEVHFRDLLKRSRRFHILERISPTEVLATCSDGAYIGPGTKIEHRDGKGKIAETLDFSPEPLEIRLYEGDLLLLTRAAAPGEPQKLDASGNIIAPAHISCQQPEIFSCIKSGEKVWMDDGRIGALIEKIDDVGAWLRITHARKQGEKLGAEKGLNFPDSDIRLPALSEKDRTDLEFIVEHADIVGCSFFHQASDMDELIDLMNELGGRKLGIVAKIETRKAVENLPEIIIHGSRHDFGVMIARGDLALEIGYERLAEIQEEILWVCEAAHVPVIWATQVLESMVKLGLPSRAEITDAAMAERAECIMLNKGEYLLNAMAVLDNVVMRMQNHQSKKTSKFRALHW